MILGEQFLLILFIYMENMSSPITHGDKIFKNLPSTIFLICDTKYQESFDNVIL